MAKDEEGFLWAVTQFGLYRFDGYNTKTYLTSNTPFLTSDRYQRVINDKEHHRLIVAGEKDYFFVTGSTLKSIQYPDSILILSDQNYFFLPKQRLKNIVGKEINFSIFSTNIFVFEKDTLLLYNEIGYNLTKNSYLPKEVYQSFINATIFVRKGLTFFFDNSGLYELHYQNGRILKKLIFALQGFKFNIYNSNEDGIWIENEDKIIKIDLPSGKFIKTIKKAETRMGTISILDDETSGNIYQGSVSRGVYKYTLFNGKAFASNNYTSSYAYNNLLKSYCLIEKNGVIAFSNQEHEKSFMFEKESIPFSIYTDEQQRIWFQMISNKIILLDPVHKKILDTIAPDGYMIDVKQKNKDIFFIATLNKLFKYDLSHRDEEIYFTTQQNEKILSFSIINNNYYITTNNGLYVLDANKKLMHHFLSGNAIRKTIKLKHGTIAIATYGKGLFYLINNTLYTTTSDKYPALNAAVSMVLDDDNALWVICNKGAFIWNEPGKIINNSIPPPDHAIYVEKDLPCSELNGGLYPDVFPNHEIALASSNGLLVFKKADLIKNNSSINFTLTSVIINDSIINKITDFRVPSGTDNLIFNIDAANLDHENNSPATYRIKELDTNWIEFPESRVIIVSRLPKGRYTIEVRNSPKDDIVVLSRFTVLPYWYQTEWAITGFVISIIVLIYFITQIRLNRQKIQQIKLEGIIKDKTKKLEQNVIKLSASEKEIKKQYRYRNKLYSILMHDLRSPLKFLSTYSLQQLEKQRKNEIDKESLSIIAESSNDLYGFINEFLYWLSNQNNENALSIKETDIAELLKELVNFYQPVTLINSNELLYFETQDNVLFKTDSDRLKIIVRNLLDNANKYTKNGIIKVSAFIDEKNILIIKIEDSGSGLPANLREVINNSATISEIDPSINANHKMGLMISKELTGQLKGSITVESEESMGSVFTLKFRTA